jgi:class 3 adenylate cyclase/tetratricopeptide (TPR) repeat protein
VDTGDLQQIAIKQRAKVKEFQRKHRVGLLTLLFSDIVDSTKLKQTLGDREAVPVIQRHHAAIREILSQFSEGEEIETAGDSFFVVFTKPSEAVKFSLLVQARLRELSAEVGQPVFDRIGIHVGEVWIDEHEERGKAKDLYGLQVDTCARVQSLGQADQILLTRFPFDSAHQALRGEDLEQIEALSWLNHGPYLMKGVEEPLEICEVGEQGKAKLARPPDSAKAHRFVYAANSNLPTELPLPLIGREREVEKGISFLRDSRLVTVHAPPGVGKSRVVLRIAHRAYDLLDHLPTYFFDVNYKSSADDVAEQIRAFFDFDKFNSAVSIQEQLGNRLNAFGPMLLVLDNFEQIGSYQHRANAAKVASQTIRVWLERAKELRVLVGSRRSLELSDWKERCIHLRALPAPSLEEARSLSPDRLRAFESVQLFISLAREHDCDLEPCTVEELRSIAHIVAMTGGFPAPITVAASRLKNCGLDLIEEIMSNTFVRPEGTDEAKARAYLHTQLDQVFETLSPLEQNCLLQASQFRGGFDFSAAAAVFSFGQSAGVLSKRQVEPVLSNLVLAELLTLESVSSPGRSERRYGFYLPIEEWAEERWEEGRYISLQDRKQHYHRCHDHYCHLFEQQNALISHQEKSVHALTMIGLDRQNLIECHSRACEGAEAARAFRSLKALLPFLLIQGPATLLEEVLEKTLKSSNAFTPSEHAELLKERSKCLYALGRYSEMLVPAQQAVELAEKAGNTRILVQCLSWKGNVLGMTTGERGSLVDWEKIRNQLRADNDLSSYAEASRYLAGCYDWAGQSDAALHLLDETMRTLGSQNPMDRAMLMNCHGIIGWHNGLCLQAAGDYVTAWRIFFRQGNQRWLGGLLTNLGLALIDLERFAAARRLLMRAQKKHVAVGNDGWNAVNNVAIARLHLREGRHLEAIAWCENVTQSVEATEYYENKALLTSIHAMALFGAGDLNVADEKLRLTLNKMRPGSTKMRRYFDVLVTAAECAIAMGDEAFAKECILEAEGVAALRKIDGKYPVSYYRSCFERMFALRSILGQTSTIL